MFSLGVTEGPILPKREKPTWLVGSGWVLCCSKMLTSIAHPHTHTELQQQQQSVEVVLSVIAITDLLYRAPAKLA
jgi:hypothetical protein